jgi:protein SCO1
MLARRRSNAWRSVGALVLALTVAGCSSQASRSSSTRVSSASASGFDGAALPGSGVAVAGFALRDQQGARVSLASMHGSVVVLAFVFTTCGAPCTVIAEQIRGALDELRERVPVLLVSAEPAVDTRARIAAFLARTSLSGRARYLTGTLAQLRPVWRSLHVVPASAGSRRFSEYASVFVLDRNGRERVIFQLEQLTPEALAHDISKLLAER